MAVELEIRDGDPWWASPDIWVVPGDDPEGTPGTPIANIPAFIWARVRNNGSSPVQNATVRFYWADPSAGFDRNSANIVGTSFVTLDPEQTSDVLCLQPWIPVFINGGHECVLAEAFHTSADPLPATPQFNVPTDRHVAQRNLSIALASTTGFFRYSFSIFNTSRKDTEFSIALQTGTDAQLKPLRGTLDPAVQKAELTGKLAKAAFVDDQCAGEDKVGSPDKAKLNLKISANSKSHHTLVGNVRGGSVLLHVVQSAGDRIIGGTSVLVLSNDYQKKE